MSGDPSKPDTVKFSVVEYGSPVVVSKQLLEPGPSMAQIYDSVMKGWLNYQALTPDERAERDRLHREKLDAQYSERYARDNLRHSRTMACLHGDENPVVLLRELAALHSPGMGHDESCTGCREGVSGYEYDLDPWPCSTFLLIEGHTWN